MLKDFKAALAKVQSNYGFYIDCQTDPALALAGYDLSSDERSALSDPVKLADVLRPRVGLSPFKITISGTHDWVNRAGPVRPRTGKKLEARIEHELDTIRHASTDEERTGAALRLMELLG
jgi:hypothetical protein